MHRSLLSLCLLWLCWGTLLRAQELGRPIIQNYAVRDYQQHNQNWGGAQDSLGFIYFGNRDCVIRFDGVAWKTLPVPGGNFIRGVAVTHDDTLYVGGVNQLGYFPATTTGEREFVSLIDQLPESERDFRAITQVSVFGNAVCFAAENKVLVWQGGKFRVEPFEGGRPRASATALYFSTKGKLKKFDGRTWTTVSESTFFQRGAITFAQEISAGELLIGTPLRGIFQLRIGHTPEPFVTEADDLFRREEISGGLRMRDGSLAVSLYSTGVVLLAPDGRLQTVLEESNGLQTPLALRAFEDREGGLWLGLNSGVSRVNWPAGVTVFDSMTGLRNTSVYDITRHDDRLLITSDNGLFELSPANTDERRAQFHKLAVTAAGGSTAGQPLTGPAYAFASYRDGVVISTDLGLVYREKGLNRLVFPARRLGWEIRPSRREPSVFFVTCFDGVQVVRATKSGLWENLGMLPGIDAEVRTIFEYPDGSLWVSSSNHGYFRVTFPGAIPASAQVENFNGRAGMDLLTGIKRVRSWGGEPVFTGTGSNLFSFDQTTQQFLPFTGYGIRPEGLSISNIGVNQPKHLWMHASSTLADAGPWQGKRIYRAGRDGRWTPFPYLIAELSGMPQSFYEEKTAGGSVLWIGGSESLLRVDVDRALETTSLLPPVLSEATAETRRPYTHNTLEFTFVSPTFRPAALVEYQTILSGFKEAHHAWSAQTTRTFTNLTEGNYVFEVRARDSDGQISAPVSFHFTILPPWWRSLWAYGGYGLLLVGAGLGLAHWRSRALRHRNEALTRLVATRTDELRVARDAAEDASRAKSAFLANMSHELRTPLNAILGYARLLHQDDSLPSASRQRAGVINDSGSHLLHVINDVLDLSKIEAGKLTLQTKPFLLGPLLRGVANVYSPLAFEKGLQLHVNLPADLPIAVSGDEHRLRQVLYNLLGNALKFTSKGSIAFTVQHSASVYRFEVNDTGIGIAPAQQQAIFRPFHQVHDQTLPNEGTGLGLAISQRIVELMKAELRVESQLGVGSRFWFEAQLEEAAPPAPSGVQIITGYQGPRRKLLVVDDEAPNRGVLRGVLEPLGFVIAEAADGLACIEQSQREWPDVVLLDLRMSRLDGFEASRRLRALASGRPLRIIAVSASVFEANRQEAIDAGCDEFLPKPIQVERLLDVLRSLLDLQWTALSPIAPASASALIESISLPSPEELAALSTLVEQGDVMRLRQQLQSLRTQRPGLAAFADTIDTLAARFKMDRIAQLLAEFQAGRKPSA